MPRKTKPPRMEKTAAVEKETPKKEDEPKHVDFSSTTDSTDFTDLQLVIISNNKNLRNHSNSSARVAFSCSPLRSVAMICPCGSTSTLDGMACTP